MKPHPKVDTGDRAALDVWLAAVRADVDELRELALDATAKKPHRQHARAWLRGRLSRRLRDLEARLDALDVQGQGQAPTLPPPAPST